MAQAITKKLGELFAALDVACPPEVLELEVCGVTDDSRELQPGMLFVAVPGDTVDGHRFIEAAVAGGCAAVLASREYAGECRVPVIIVSDTAEALGQVAAAFYDYPCRRMKMIGITGTNGKTTCTYLLEGLIRAVGGSPGVIGTVSVRYAGHESPTAMTTPQPVELQKILHRMADAGVTHVAMEVSSHALARHRVNGIDFDVALFTNLTRDHLDYHGSMERYFAEKLKLFTRHLKRGGKAVVVIGQEGQDEGGEWCSRLVQELSAADQPLITCGIGCGMIQARNFRFDLTGIRADIVTSAQGQCSLQSPLVGAFNLKNLLAAIGCGLALRLELPGICQGLAAVTGAPGRLERVVADISPGGQAAAASVFVDYAHTPDALENVLLTLRQLAPARLIVVFGCGGDRDRGKRPLMGQVAARLAEVLLVTSDNPRSEPPRSIMAEIEQGIVAEKLPQVPAEQLLQGGAGRKGYDLIEARAEAIRVAIRGARPGEVVLISGKGHERYQIIGGRKLFFDDRQQAKEQLNLARQAA